MNKTLTVDTAKFLAAMKTLACAQAFVDYAEEAAPGMLATTSPAGKALYQSITDLAKAQEADFKARNITEEHLSNIAAEIVEFRLNPTKNTSYGH